MHEAADENLMTRMRRLFEFRKRVRVSGLARGRGPITHVIIMDGTLSSLDPGCETNAGITFRLCSEAADGANMIVRYEAGIQWTSWRDTRDVIEGRGINRQIRRVYGGLASRYRPGDKIFVFGYSRGAYAARSLTGFIDKVGLLRADAATERNIRVAYRHYQTEPDTETARAFKREFCYPETPIEMVGVWDTVSAVGLHMPLLWRFSSVFHEFHDRQPARCVKRAYHALAYHERRRAYEPVMFETNPDAPEQVLQQMWFRGTHGDVGGHVLGATEGRRLSNATLVWMLDKAETAGLALPEGWRMRHLADPHGKSAGQNRGWGKFFLLRRRRRVGRDPSEVLHPSLDAARTFQRADVGAPKRPA